MPKIPVNFDEMTYEEFAQTINQSKTEYAPVALLIAASFVDENGNWDREGYKQFLNTMAGDKKRYHQQRRTYRWSSKETKRS